MEIELTFMRSILRGPYLPSHDENRMKNEGDVASARKNFIDYRFNNLEELLFRRFTWMNDFINSGDKIVEFGCGAGFSRLYIDAEDLTLTDVLDNPWVDKYADAMDPPFEDDSIDVIICSHMVHHMAKPIVFFNLVHKILKPGGRIIIQDLNTSLVLRILLRAMRHEGWSYDIDVFDENKVTNRPEDPWSANCAIPELLFESEEAFENNLKGYKIIKNDVNECLLFPLSGGVISKTKVPEFPKGLLSFIHQIDKGLVAIAPSIFALGRSVVLKKVDLPS